MVATYLIQRNGRYHFRMRVPQDLLSVINTKEIHRSLGTNDGRTAKALAITLKVKLESEFVGLRQQAILNSRLIQGLNGQSQPIPSLTHSMIQPTNLVWFVIPLELHRYLNDSADRIANNEAGIRDP